MLPGRSATFTVLVPAVHVIGNSSIRQFLTLAYIPYAEGQHWKGPAHHKPCYFCSNIFSPFLYTVAGMLHIFTNIQVGPTPNNFAVTRILSHPCTMVLSLGTSRPGYTVVHRPRRPVYVFWLVLNIEAWETKASHSFKKFATTLFFRIVVLKELTTSLQITMKMGPRATRNCVIVDFNRSVLIVLSLINDIYWRYA